MPWHARCTACTPFEAGRAGTCASFKVTPERIRQIEAKALRKLHRSGRFVVLAVSSF
jgi:hypothetical protein